MKIKLKTMSHVKILKPDSKGRISLGKIAKGISSFHMTIDQHKGKITLEPFTEIPLNESWLYLNKIAMNQVKQGIKESAEGKVKYISDFSQYLGNE